MAEENKKEIKGDEVFDRIFLSPAIAKFWANSFIVGRSPSEATIVFAQGKAVVTAVSMGYPALKTLFSEIGKTIDEVEKVLGENINDVATLMPKFSRMDEKKEN